MNVTKKAASVGLALSIVATLCATIAAPAALASTAVTLGRHRAGWRHLGRYSLFHVH